MQMNIRKYKLIVVIFFLLANLILLQNIEQCKAEPNPPTDFIANSYNHIQINLTWTLDSNNYTKIEWNTYESWARNDGFLLYFGDEDNIYEHAGLDPNTKYYYQAWSWNITSEWSITNSSYNATTEKNNPPMYESPNPSNGSTNQKLYLIWNVSISDSDADLFNWSIECSNGESNSLDGDTDGDKNLSLSDLIWSTNYIIWVNATDNYNWTRSWFNFTTRDKYIPDMPASFIAIADGRFEIDLNWSDDVKADSTRVEWSSVADGTWNFGDHSLLYNGSAQAASNSSLSPGTQRFYKAWSWNATDSVWGSATIVNATSDVHYPPNYSSPSPSNESIGQELMFIWSIFISDANGDLFNWTIECSNGNFSSGNDETNGVKTLIINNLSMNKSYTIWVNSSDNYNNLTKEWFIFNTKTLDPPLDFNAITYSKSQIDLSWIIGNYSDTTYIEWNLTSGPWIRGNGKELYNGSGNSTSHTGLNSGKTYYYSAWSWNSTEEHWSLSNSFDSAKTKSSGGSSGGGGGVPPPINNPPIANAGGPYIAYLNDVIYFDGSLSNDPDGDNISYLWDFGDGTKLLGIEPSHSYHQIKNFTIKLTVNDGELSNVNSTTVTILPNIEDNDDMDDDGYSNDMEESYGSDKLNSKDIPMDSDNDGIPDDDSNDGLFIGDDDDDNDGLTDIIEQTLGLNSKNPSDVKNIIGKDGYLLDTDNDSKPDTYYNLNNNVITPIEIDTKGIYQIDEDGDGAWNYKYDFAGGIIESIEESTDSNNEFPWILAISIIVITIIIVIFIFLKMGYIRYE